MDSIIPDLLDENLNTQSFEITSRIDSGPTFSERYCCRCLKMKKKAM